MRPDEDPGWRRSLRRIGWRFVPFYPLTRARRSESDPAGLIVLRTAFLTVVISLVFSLVVFSFIAPWGRGDDGATPLLVSIIGLVGVLSARRIADRPLDPSSAGTVAASYRTRMWIGVAVASGAGLLPFSLSFSFSNSLSISAYGVVFAELALWFVAPSRSHIAADQERIFQQGSALDLVAALNTMPSGKDGRE